MKETLKRVAYFFLQLFSGNKGIRRTINGFSIRFPARWSRYYETDYESGNYQYLKEKVKPGMHIIDIGAHLGLFSTISSALTGEKGKVVCFEPTPGTYSILKQTLELNNCKNVIPVQGAVSGANGTATFYVSETAGCNSNSLVKNNTSKQAKGYEVKLFTIDTIVEQFSIQPGLIKIDAEGSELDVLTGATKTLNKYKPLLILGLHPAFIKQKGDSLETIWDLLQKAEYGVEMNEKEMVKEDFCSRDLLFDVHCYSKARA